MCMRTNYETVVCICSHAHILWLSCIYRLTLLSHEWTNDTRKIRLISSWMNKWHTKDKTYNHEWTNDTQKIRLIIMNEQMTHER
jgi:hypothetical protein